MRRSEIWTAAGPGYASKPRPVVIVHDDKFDATDSVTACLLTTDDTDATLLRIPVPASDQNGLSRDSRLMVDKLMTTRRAQLHEQVGTLESEHVLALERGLLVFLGIAS